MGSAWVGQQDPKSLDPATNVAPVLMGHVRIEQLGPQALFPIRSSDK
jgi:hypothetical protein